MQLIALDCVEGPKKKGERPDVKLFWPEGASSTHGLVVPGAEFLGPRISASAIETFGLCRRKWGLRAFDKLPKKPSKASLLGQRGHDELEAWLVRGVPPELPFMTDSGILQHFPSPRTPHLRCEAPFAFAWVDDVGAPVVFFGYMDVEDQASTVYDLKTTSDLAWALSAEELATDTQGCIYALAMYARYGCAEVQLAWNYTRTRGKPLAHPVRATISVDQAVVALEARVRVAQQMVALKATPPAPVRLPILGASSGFSKPLTGAGLDATWESCKAYGGCDFWEVCTDRPAKTTPVAAHRQDGLLAARLKKAPGRATAEEKTMGLMDKIRANIAQEATTNPAAAAKLAKVDAAVASAPTVTVVAPAAGQAPGQAAGQAAVAVAPASAAAGHVATVTSPAEAAAKVSRLSALIAARTGGAPKPGAATKEQAATQVATALVAADMPPEKLAASGLAPEKLAEIVTQNPGVSVAGITPAGSAPAAEGPSSAAEPEKKRRGRPRKAAPEERVAGSVGEALATDATVVVRANAAEDARLGSFTVFLDVLPVRGQAFQPLDDIIAPARAAVEKELGMPYRCYEYGKGPPLLAAELDEQLQANPPLGVYGALSATVDREVLDVLCRHAAVYMGMR